MNKIEFNLMKKLEEIRHKNNMEELEFQEKIERLKFDMQKELQRIKSAEIRRSIERKMYKQV